MTKLMALILIVASPLAHAIGIAFDTPPDAIERLRESLTKEGRLTEAEVRDTEFFGAWYVSKPRLYQILTPSRTTHVFVALIPNHPIRTFYFDWDGIMEPDSRRGLILKDLFRKDSVLLKQGVTWQWSDESCEARLRRDEREVYAPRPGMNL